MLQFDGRRQKDDKMTCRHFSGGTVMPATISAISKRPDRCGGDACIRDLRIPVWAIVNCRRLGMTDTQILRAYPSLSTSDLSAAFEYATANPDEIDRAISRNQEGEEGFAG
jgi:uncharacterized protein (DUF433 family)